MARIGFTLTKSSIFDKRKKVRRKLFALPFKSTIFLGAFPKIEDSGKTNIHLLSESKRVHFHPFVLNLCFMIAWKGS